MGRVHSIETLGALDGPGLRMVVFLQGCPLRCRYCHNPDTWCAGGGQELSEADIAARAARYRRFFGKTGGVTFSGGEPLLQADFVLKCVRALHEEGIHCALDTGAGLWNEAAARLCDAADLVILDVKHSDPAGFRRLTGGDIGTLEQALAHLRAAQKPTWVRQVIVEGYTQDEGQVRALREKVRGLNLERLELLPYHTLGVHKWKALGLPYALEGVAPPDETVMARLRALL